MIDIGANLTNESFQPDFAEVLERSKHVGIERIIVTGTHTACAQQAQSLAAQYPDYLCSTAGLHPHHAKDFNEATIDCFRQLLHEPEVVAIGETGLDFNRNFSTPEQQVKSFEAHLQLGDEFDKPFFLHERDSYPVFFEIMQAHQPLCERAIVHCFTGNKTSLKSYLDLGMHIGVTGWICDKKRGKELREIIGYAPLDRLMIESDAPYLMPHRDKLKHEMAHKHRNEPCTLPYTLRGLSEALGEDETVVRERTTRNARHFFRLS